jgi:spermidine synthase
MSAIKYKFTKKVNIDELVHLYKTAGWWDEGDVERLALMIKKTYLFVGAYDGERLIGMGRCLSDGISDAYIQDVTVLPEYRRQGIGGKIIKALVTKLYERSIMWVSLIGEPGTQHFYEELGFKVMENYVPMHFFAFYGNDK